MQIDSMVHTRVVNGSNLIENFEQEIDRLQNFLNIKFNKDMIKNKILENMTFHMTSSDQNSSIRRWQKEMSQDIQEIFEQEMGALLSSLGY